MGVRLLIFFLCLGTGAALSVWVDGGALHGGVNVWAMAWWGAVLGALGWFVADLVRARHFLQWVRRPETAPEPGRWDVWGQAAEFVRRHARRQQQAQRASEHRLDDFLRAIQASPNGVVLLDDVWRIEWCNEAAAQLLELHAQRDCGQHIGFLVREPAFAAYLAAHDFRREVTLERWRDQQRILSLSVHPYSDGRYLMLARDVTALARTDAMRRDFVANVSHEIRTPLTVLSGCLETLQSLPLSPAEQAQYLELMATQAQRMQSLVNDLLTLSRLEEGVAPSDGEQIAVAELLTRCEQEGRALSALLYAPPAVAQRLHFEAPPGLALRGAEGELQSACANLVNNAVRYTPAGGRIDVAWRVLPDGRAEFSVTDTGVGIAPEHLPRISERFYRVDRSRSRETGGTGLGLAIAKHIAQRHGGELSIDSRLGQGSRFALRIGADRVCAVPAA